MKQSILVLLVFSLFCVWNCFSVGLAQQLDQPGLPLRIVDVQQSITQITRETRLLFEVENQLNVPIEEIVISVLFSDSDGRVHGYQRSKLSLDLGPKQTNKFVLPLGNLLYTEQLTGYDRVNLAVEEVRANSHGWKTSLEPVEFAAALKHAQSVPVIESDLEVLSSQQCQIGFCTYSRQNAVQTCGVGCVKSVDCDINMCRCVYTCKTLSEGCTNPG